MAEDKILILGSSNKAGVYVTKQVKKNGFHTTVIDWKNLPSRFSKYVDRYLDIGSPEVDMQLFTKSFIQHLEGEKYRAILPLHDVALEVVRTLQPIIPSSVHVLGLNPTEIYKYAHDKWELIKLAKQIGIAVPETIYIDSLEALKENTNKIKFPCVIKPPSSARVTRDKITSFSVRFAADKEKLLDIVRETINNSPILVQESINGYGIGYNLIANKGEILNAYVHKRINENKGVSTYREILSPESFGLQKPMEELIKAINWTGVAMVEFKVQDNVPVLMEMNGRFYGSIELAIKSGLNYPKQFLEIELYKKIPKKNIPFRMGTRVRNLHDEILLNGAALFKGNFLRFLKWFISILKTTLSSNEYIEDNVFSDPGFVLGLYLNDIKRMSQKLRYRIRYKYIPFKYQLLKLRKKRTLRIAFICTGNICRSPFAQWYAKKNKPGNEYYSYGTYKVDGRMSPMNAVDVAGEFGVNLESFLSSSLKVTKISDIDYFLVMDKINYCDMVNMGISPKKIRFLCESDIPDPYSKDKEYFRYIYKKIADAIDKL